MYTKFIVKIIISIFEDESNIGYGCILILFSSNLLKIEEKVLIAAYSYIMSGGRYDFPVDKEFVYQDTYSRGPTVIGSNVWVGAKVVIVDGVRVGENSIIGAGSVILRDIPPNCVVFGVPGKIYKHL